MSKEKYPPIEVKPYMLPYPVDNTEAKKEMIAEGIAHAKVQRYGFFSILHSNFIGDEQYSRDTRKKILDANGKVITKPRGIFPKSTKKGKFIDSYFDASFLMEDKEMRKRMEEIAKLEAEDRLTRVKNSKKKAENFTVAFKPAGPQEYKDSLYPDKIQWKQPLYAISEKQKNIDFKAKKVNTERRGVFTQPDKSGAYSLPGVLFSYDKVSKEDVQMYKEMTKKEIADDIEKKRIKVQNPTKNFKPPFIPNSTAKCDTFQKDKDLYLGNLESDLAEIQKLVEKAKELKKNLRQGLIKVEQPSKAEICKKNKWFNHISEFIPASLTKSVSIF